MIKTKNFIITLLSSLVFFITFFNIDKFKDGDIIKYNKVYNFFYAEKEIRESYFATHNTSDIWGNQSNSDRDYYSKYLTSKEYLHFFLIYLFSFILDYEIFLSLINFLFAFTFLQVLHAYNVNLFISSLLIFTNYYVLILYFSMERLKIGIIILLILFSYAIKNKKNFKKLIFLGLITSCLAHLQMAIVFVSHYFEKILSEIHNFLFNFKIRFTFFFSLFAGLIFILISYQQIIYKLQYNININFNFLTLFSTFIKIFIFYILTILYSDKKYHIYITSFYTSIFLVSLLIGGDRLIIVLFFFFLIFSLKHNRGLNFGVLLVSTYFLFKSYTALYSFDYCYSLNFSVSECRTMYNNPYGRIVLNHPNIFSQTPIRPSDQYYKQKFHEQFTFFLSHNRSSSEDLNQHFEILEEYNQ